MSTSAAKRASVPKPAKPPTTLSALRTNIERGNAAASDLARSAASSVSSVEARAARLEADCDATPAAKRRRVAAPAAAAAATTTTTTTTTTAAAAAAAVDGDAKLLATPEAAALAQARALLRETRLVAQRVRQTTMRLAQVHKQLLVSVDARFAQVTAELSKCAVYNINFAAPSPLITSPLEQCAAAARDAPAPARQPRKARPRAPKGAAAAAKKA